MQTTVPVRHRNHVEIRFRRCEDRQPSVEELAAVAAFLRGTSKRFACLQCVGGADRVKFVCQTEAQESSLETRRLAGFPGNGTQWKSVAS